MQTAALAAYVLSRKMKFAGAPVTLGKLLKMWQLPHDGVAETIDGAALEGVARYCKLTVEELTAAVNAMTPPEPVPLVTFQTVTIPPAPEPAPLPPALAPEPAPSVIEATRSRPEPTTVMPEAQLTGLVAASRRSSPVIEAPPQPEAPDDHDVEISFDEVEATPIPEAPEATSTAVAETKPADAKSGKSKKGKKKKS